MGLTGLLATGNVLSGGPGSGYLGVFTLCSFIELYRYELCTLLYVCYTSAKVSVLIHERDKISNYIEECTVQGK